MKTLTRPTKRTAALYAIPGLLLTAAAGVTTTAPANAQSAAPSGDVSTQSCSHSHSNKDATSGHVDADWLRYRSGPHTYCTAYGQAASGTRIYYHCYVGTYPNSWTHGRIAGTNRNGWFSDPYLTDHGSLEHC